jgi:hypothetical protein
MRSTLGRTFLVCVLAAVASARPAPAGEAIDREAVVRRHNVRVTGADRFASLTVGNGRFAFTADVTGLQTFPAFYAQDGVPLTTMAEWAWHSHPNETRARLEDTYEAYDTYGRQVKYPTDTRSEAAQWLRANPHKIDLGRIGLVLEKEDGTGAAIDDLTAVGQTLDLWRGLLTSTFSWEGQHVAVETCCHPEVDAVALRIRSALVAEGRLAVSLGFSYGSGAWGRGIAGEGREDRHTTSIVSEAPGRTLLRRVMDDLTYHVTVAHSNGAKVRQRGVHRYQIDPDRSAAAFECVVTFAAAAGARPPSDFAAVRSAAAEHWRAFWESGGAIDLSGSTDPRWKELERRIVLSQYLIACQSTGELPPQETGLTLNSWHGKFHLEMHWWHGVHFALWGRLPLLERSLPWYRRIMPRARETARFQGYDGVRWPKMVGPGGRESPSGIGPLLIWQQPHPIYYAELCYREHGDRGTLERYRDTVFETAAFMASFPVWNRAKQQFDLGPPLIGAPEIYGRQARTLKNQNFEIAYWRFGLATAQRWRERLGMPRNETWDRILDHLPPLARKNGLYVAGENTTETFEGRNQGHPCLVAPLGFLPGTGVDRETMRRTLKEIMRRWDWRGTWGWDFPMLAMTAARLGEGAIAVDALLLDTPKNRYLPNGHNHQSARLPVYLPGNGGLLAAVAMMAAGWDGCPDRHAPGFPDSGAWSVRWEGGMRAP